jgi:hypothetical protein
MISHPFVTLGIASLMCYSHSHGQSHSHVHRWFILPTKEPPSDSTAVKATATFTAQNKSNTYIHACIHTYIHTHTHTHTYIQSWSKPQSYPQMVYSIFKQRLEEVRSMSPDSNTHVCPPYVCVSLPCRLLARLLMYMCVCIYIYTHTHTCMHTYIYSEHATTHFSPPKRPTRPSCSDPLFLLQLLQRSCTHGSRLVSRHRSPEPEFRGVYAGRDEK